MNIMKLKSWCAGGVIVQEDDFGEPSEDRLTLTSLLKVGVRSSHAIVLRNHLIDILHANHNLLEQLQLHDCETFCSLHYSLQ
jgi:hypothetical protein